jgi:hypothetical protein
MLLILLTSVGEAAIRIMYPVTSLSEESIQTSFRKEFFNLILTKGCWFSQGGLASSISDRQDDRENIL